LRWATTACSPVREAALTVAMILLRIPKTRMPGSSGESSKDLPLPLTLTLSREGRGNVR
jgi:hypothetical protein